MLLVFAYPVLSLKSHKGLVLARVGCQTWNRTKITGIRILCPTIRRSGNASNYITNVLQKIRADLKKELPL